MNVRLCRLIIFTAGAAVGAVVSHFATKRVVERMWWDECDRELNELNLKHKEDMKSLRDEIAQLKDTVTQQTVSIQTMREKLEKYEGSSDSGTVSDDEECDRPKDQLSEAEAYNRALQRRYGGTDEDELEDDYPREDDDYHEEEEIVIEQHKMERIDELTFDTTGFEYGKEELRYYMYDGKVVNEDGEWLDNFAEFVGDGWINEGKNGDVIYIRNWYYLTDYKIIFIADFGEGHISYTGSDWED